MAAYQPKLLPFSQKVEPLSIFWKNGLLLRATNWLGDALMTLPATWQLKQLLPQGIPLHILCPAFLKPLWEACPWVDAVISQQGHRLTSVEIADIQKRKYDAAMLFPNSFGTAWELWKCRIPRRLGRRGRLRGFLLTDTLPEWPRANGSADRHQLSWYLNLVSLLGEVTYTAEMPPLRLSPAPAAHHGVHPGENWLALAPGAAYGPAKQWPAESYAEIARRHLAAGGHVAFIGSGKERELTESLASQCPGSLSLGGKTGLDELMSILSCCQAAVCNDSGSMHLAAACGLRGVAVFGSTDPIATGPIGAPWELLIADTPCRPCFQRICRQADAYRCLRSISPDQVWNALQPLLA